MSDSLKVLEIDAIDPVVLPGVDRKIISQVNCLKASGLSCQRLILPQKKETFTRLLRRIPFAPDGVPWHNVPLVEINAYYFRKPDMITSDFLGLLNSIKNHNPNSKIIIEIPTYPYDSEMLSLKDLPKLARDRAGRKKLKNNVDRIVSMTNEDRIFGVTNIRVINGIDLQKVKSRRPAVKRGSVNIVCVAAFARWHGVDRMLKGLASYCGTENSSSRQDVFLHLVGDGPELRSLFENAKRLGILRNVEFYGQCNSEEMDAVYDNCTLAVECLGMHRRGGGVSSSLKSREYLAKGIPFVYSGEIDVLREEPADFCLQVPADDSPVDIQGLVDFHDALYAREPEEALIARIRAYAERHVSMEKAMANVIGYIKEECGE